MGDSDEEYDRRRARDKFRGERSDYERRPRDYRDRRRGADDWNDRRRENNWDWNEKRGRDNSWDSRKRGGDYYRDNDRTRRDSGSGGRQLSPPMKRNRRDWDSSFGDEYQNYGAGSNMAPVGGPWGATSNAMPMSSGNEPLKQSTPNAAGEQGSQVPLMMTFKQFILAQEDEIEDSEGIRRFQEYKTEFKRTQISDFFVLHKEEEWFKEKYHPVDAEKHQKEARKSVKHRLKVFLDLLEKGHLDDISLDNQNSDEIMKLLDKVVIKLEGGTDTDLNVLDVSHGQTEENENIQAGDGKDDQPMQESEPLSPSSVPLPNDPPPGSQKMGENGDCVPQDSSGKHSQPKEEEHEFIGDRDQEKSTEPKVDNELPAKSTFAVTALSSKSGSKKEKRRKHREPYHYDDDDDDESESESESDASEPAPPGEDGDVAGATQISEDEIKEGVSSTSVVSNRIVGSSSQAPVDSSEVEGDMDANLKPPGVDDDVESDQAPLSEPVPPGSETADEKEACNEAMGLQKDLRPDSLPSTTSRDENSIHSTDVVEGDAHQNGRQTEKSEDDQEIRRDDSKAVDSTTEEVKNELLKPRPLHKTLSLFLRNVPPTIAKADIVTVCKRYPGFMRVAMADPSPERRFFRRAWITFDSSVNIKDICWNLSNIRIKETESNPVVNRDLSKRIRAISGITLAKDVVYFDIGLASKLVLALDDKYKLYETDEPEVKEDDMETETKENQTVGRPQEDVDTTQSHEENDTLSCVEIPDANPVLTLVPDLPKEEREDTFDSREQEKEAELPKEKEKTVDFNIDASVMKALDKLILYLRIVHSLDYYNGSDYPHEDDMPNRCGVIHIRGIQPEKTSNSEVSDWKKNTESKLSHHLTAVREKLNEDDAVKLGKKESAIEVENFVTANTQELAKDKWLCPLSGKKFKGPEFVRKHIFNKHGDKLDAVKKEVDFFNHYLYDPQRPHFPDQNPGRDASSANATPSVNQSPFNPQQPMYQMGWNPRGHHMMYGPRSHFTPPAYGGFRGGPDIHSRGGHSYTPKPRRGGMVRDPRSIITYKDLDAPDDADFF